jgi:hypothetical protein
MSRSIRLKVRQLALPMADSERGRVPAGQGSEADLYAREGVHATMGDTAALPASSEGSGAARSMFKGGRGGWPSPVLVHHDPARCPSIKVGPIMARVHHHAGRGDR